MICLLNLFTGEAEIFELPAPMFSRALQLISSNLISTIGYVTDPLLYLLLNNNPFSLSQMEV